ncbi:DgyrCDS5194 [Dimorphilus gyrociliatus]|uniref:DgyrCDS5194 n=1 Tax=Dimorphilus gyrociliatus TaxID=2664684 RepID=A0A7I8VKR5_9ANNE|nr:DgyrCDS5194 [Dimorphilus gyrociliatus]
MEQNVAVFSSTAATYFGAPHLRFAAAGPVVMPNSAVQTMQIASNLGEVPLTNTAALSQQSTTSLSNPKEKTPMSLVNELARYNKIDHCYTLVDEKGPPHEKVFYFNLQLGEEVYQASGPSIKKAQHKAADTALKSTKYLRPTFKSRPHSNRNSTNTNNSGSNPAITPTVELNALAMKRGEKVSYKQVQCHQQPSPNAPFVNGRGMSAPRLSHTFCMSVCVGPREFLGEGSTRQAAKHDAASKALRLLKSLPLPSQTPDKTNSNTVNGDSSSSIKSNISQLHELALKLHLDLNFKVANESGPAHMKSFTILCTAVGQTGNEKINEEVSGCGNSKKLAKKEAAKMMLTQLSSLPVPESSIVVRPKRNTNNGKNKIKQQKACPEYGQEVNPISRLIHIQQAKKDTEPEYNLISEEGQGRKKEFTIQVKIGQNIAIGKGPNKKLAKRAAAEEMLENLGYHRQMAQPSKPAIRNSSEGQHDKKNVSFSDDKKGCQLAPGLLYMNNGTKKTKGNRDSNTMFLIAKQLVDNGESDGLADVSRKATAEENLKTLCDRFDIEMTYTDFPRGGDKTAVITLLKVNTCPPQVTHGSAETKAEARETAAQIALEKLAEMLPHQLSTAVVSVRSTSTITSSTSTSTPT